MVVLRSCRVIVSSYHYLVGPLVAAGALGVIILICRWVFSTTHRDDRTARRLEKARARGDYGLLVPITSVRTPDDAAMLRTVLHDAGIRCTVGETAGDSPGLAVLVFRADAERARDLVSSRP
jgi:hypothetical protein